VVIDEVMYLIQRTPESASDNSIKKQTGDVTRAFMSYAGVPLLRN